MADKPWLYTCYRDDSGIHRGRRVALVDLHPFGASSFPLFGYVIDFGIRVARELLKRDFDGLDGPACGVQQPSPHILSLKFSFSLVFLLLSVG